MGRGNSREGGGAGAIPPRLQSGGSTEGVYSRDMGRGNSREGGGGRDTASIALANRRELPVLLLSLPACTCAPQRGVRTGTATGREAGALKEVIKRAAVGRAGLWALDKINETIIIQ